MLPSQMHLVRSCEVSRSAWLALTEHFISNTSAKHFHLEITEGTTVTLHLKQMKELTNQLAVLGAPMREEDHIVTLLDSFPQPYSTWAITWEVCGDDLTVGYVQQALKHEEQKPDMTENVSAQGSSSCNMKSAMFGKQKQRKCYKCGAEGHFNTFASSLNQKVHTKTTGSHVTLREYNSGAESNRKLFKRSKDLASLEVCNEKQFLVSGHRFFVSDIISEGLLGHLGPLHLALGPNR